MKRLIMSLFAFAALAAGLTFSLGALADTQAKHESATHASCEDRCKSCQSVCEKTLKYCQQKGGKHVEPGHIALLKDCITACKSSADYLSRNSALHAKACAICAEACNKCAESCEKFDDKQMKDCAAECRKCAESCTKMSG